MTRIVAAEGVSRPVSIFEGICQRYPLSGLLFNVVVNPFVHYMQGSAGQYNILACANDPTPLAATPSALQEQIDQINYLARA